VYRPGSADKILFALTVLGAVVIVAAIAFFSLTGSGVGADLLLFTGGFLLGMVAATVLTRSRRRGRLVAAVVLLVIVVGCLALVLARPDWLVASVEHEPGWMRFATSLVSSMAGISLLRVFGVNLLEPRGDQASRRRA
jgi:drug/metabolite transporter (DMT)-like permease